jgi:hypothetical protein
VKHWLIHLFVDDTYLKKEVYDKCRKFLNIEDKATAILYLIDDSVCHSIPDELRTLIIVICIPECTVTS